jgi:hypothetical protein
MNIIYEKKKYSFRNNGLHICENTACVCGKIEEHKKVEILKHKRN